MYQAFMETAWQFPGRQHNLWTPLGGAVVDQRQLAHNNHNAHLTPISVADKTCLGISKYIM